MIRYSWKSVINNSRVAILTILSFVAIFLTLPMTLSNLFDIKTEVESNIQEYARGSYDILIRPLGSKTNIEAELGKVQENYLTHGEGGITLDEWEKIKNIEDVSIAAPVISLGHFTGEDKTFSLEHPSESSYYELDFITSDGVNNYTLSDEGGFFYMLEQDNYVEGFDFYNGNELSFLEEGMKPEFSIPNTYHFTVGVDQEEEEKLTGIDLSDLNNAIPDRLAQFDRANRNIPIIYLTDAYIPLKGNAKVSSLDWNSQKTIDLKEAFSIEPEKPFFLSDQFSTLPNILSDVDRISLNEFEIPLYEFMKPFSYEPFMYKDRKSVV